MDKKNKERLEKLQKLFEWKSPLELVDSSGQVIDTVYQRLVGDADLNKARTTALRYSRELRMKLKDETSDEFIAFIDGYTEFPKNDLITLILFDELMGIRQRVEKEFHFPEPAEPKDDASTEDYEETQNLEDTYEDRYLEALNKRVEEALENRRLELETLDEQDILDKVKQSRIESLCDQELRDRFTQMCVYCGTYLDDGYKYKLFNSYEELVNSPESLKSQLIAGYNSLEISSINLKGFLKTQPLDQLST